MTHLADQNPYGYSRQPFDPSCNFQDATVTVTTTTVPSTARRWMPSNFTLVTYNLWGVPQFTFSLSEQRLPYIVQLLRQLNADVLCLQEVSHVGLDYLLQDPWLSQHYCYSETRWAGRHDVICLTLSKVTPQRTHIYGFRCGLFPNDIIVTEFDDRLIVNMNFHPGSNQSPGVTDSTLYAQCRLEQLKMLQQVLAQVNSDATGHIKPVWLASDFNVDLNGTEAAWPELTQIRAMGLVDTWAYLRPGEPGFTEDTVINEVRWNTKQMDKQVRYDAIMYTPNHGIVPQRIEIFGQNRIMTIPFDQFQQLTHRLHLTFDKGFRVDGQTHYSAETIPYINWYPSDHFGVVAEFHFERMRSRL